ncbi:MAG: hypothetical protein PHD19_09380 [Dechloromonas sp.]|nr:hypothetical protein [Dechloromonas sp.]
MLDESLFVSSELHEREVKIGQKTIRLHFRELPAVDFIRFHDSLKSGDEDAKAGATAKIVASAVCNSDGTPAMSYEKALTLKPVALNALFSAAMEVSNGSDAGNA